jgi:peptidoglycan hydrolase FlgJ
MSLNAINILEPAVKQKPSFDVNNPRDVAAARHAAMEFESMLLTQLTAALSPPADEDEESVFGGNTSNYYRQMFSEKMAHQLAEQGGVGLADSIMQKLGVDVSGLGARRVTNASMAARSLRGEAPLEATNHEAKNNAVASPAKLEAAPATRPRVVRREKPATLPVVEAAAAPVSPTATEIRDASRLRMPLRGRVSSQFGARRDPIRGAVREHHGVDIAAARGTPIAAAASGKVVFAGKRGGYGNLVEIEHADGRRTRYAHAEKITVKVGDEVAQGETVATVGSTGRSTGPHLHFEVKARGARVDPLQAVAKDSAPTRR